MCLSNNRFCFFVCLFVSVFRPKKVLEENLLNNKTIILPNLACVASVSVGFSERLRFRFLAARKLGRAQH